MRDAPSRKPAAYCPRCRGGRIYRRSRTDAFGRWMRTPTSAVRRRGSWRGSRSWRASSTRRLSPERPSLLRSLKRTPWSSGTCPTAALGSSWGALGSGLDGRMVVQVLADHHDGAACVAGDLLGGTAHKETPDPAELLSDSLVSPTIIPAIISSLQRRISSSGLPIRR